MNFIKRLILNAKDTAGKVGAERWIVYSLLVVLLASSVIQCKNNKPCPDIATVTSEIQDSLLRTIVTESHTDFDTKPEGDTIFIEKVRTEYKEHTTFVKNWNDLQDLSRKHQDLAERHARTVAELEALREQKEEIDENGAEVWTFTETEKLPIVETDKSIKGENYEIKEKIWSRGQLERFEREITVHPEVVTITKTEKEYLKRHNFLALKYGALYIDDLKNVKYTPSIEYGHKWFVIEAGAVLDQNYNFEGIETKAGLVFKFK